MLVAWPNPGGAGKAGNVRGTGRLVEAAGWVAVAAVPVLRLVVTPPTTGGRTWAAPEAGAGAAPCARGPTGVAFSNPGNVRPGGTVAGGGVVPSAGVAAGAGTVWAGAAAGAGVPGALVWPGGAAIKADARPVNVRR